MCDASALVAGAFYRKALQEVITVDNLAGETTALVLALMAVHANQEGVAELSLSEIAEGVDRSKRHIVRSIHLLDDLGLLEIIHKKDRRGGHMANHYRLILD